MWLVGDLGNRGPDSLGTLRWVRDQGDSVVSVLGNHDLHLLARYEGILGARRRDTLDPVLEAADAGALCDWLADRPFVHREGRELLVHAGVPPDWTLDDIERGAELARRALRQDRRGFLDALYALRGEAAERGPVSPAAADGARAASAFTRLRIVDREGAPEFAFDGPPEAIPAGYRPWFEKSNFGKSGFERSPAPGGLRVLFGHWAALGLMVSEHAVCLDSGCVWGGSLTAMRLEDGSFVIQPAVPGDSPPPPSKSEIG